MSKRVIYIINCVFNDEWHLKEEARKKLLADREHMFDEHINSIFDSGWDCDEQNKWSKVTINSIKKYAERSAADLIEINEDALGKMDIPDSFHQYQKANLLKFHALKHFVNSDYEKALYLDLDIFVTNDAPDIFSEKTWFDHQDEKPYEKGFYMQNDMDTINAHGAQAKLKYFFDIDIDIKHYSCCFEKSRLDREFYFENNTLYNGGAWFCDKTVAERLCEVIPNDNEWTDFFSRFNLKDNKSCPETQKGEVTDQDLFIYFFKSSGITVKPLGARWNCPLHGTYDVIEGKELPPERLYFIHFFKGETESPSVRDLLCFLKNKRSINYKSFKQLIFLFIEGKIDVDVL